MKLTQSDIGRVVAYRSASGQGTGRIAGFRATRSPHGQSALMEDLTGPLAEDGGWTWIRENCLTPIHSDGMLSNTEES